MIFVQAGTETYGRVKAVQGTPIVTKFAMLQFLPLWPLQSYYFGGFGERTSIGIPLIAHEQSVAIHGIPLARIDRMSVTMAYARGLFGAMLVIGFLAIVPGIMFLTGERLDPWVLTVVRVLVGVFVAGVLGGALTYIIPFTSKREREIRSSCAIVLGVAIDPAQVAPEVVAWIEQSLNGAESIHENDAVRDELIRHLIASRCAIAQGLNVSAMEQETDKVLNQLRETTS